MPPTDSKDPTFVDAPPPLNRKNCSPTCMSCLEPIESTFIELITTSRLNLWRPKSVFEKCRTDEYTAKCCFFAPKFSLFECLSFFLHNKQRQHALPMEKVSGNPSRRPKPYRSRQLITISCSPESLFHLFGIDCERSVCPKTLVFKLETSFEQLNEIFCDISVNF